MTAEQFYKRQEKAEVDRIIKAIKDAGFGILLESQKQEEDK